MNNNNSNGAILISCLLLLMLAAGLCLLLVLHAHNIFISQKDSFLNAKKREESLESLFKISSNLDNKIANENFICLSPSPLIKAAQPYKICERIDNSSATLTSQFPIEGLTLSDTSTFPQFDFAGLLKNPDNCSNLRPQTARLSAFGNSLSATSSVWNLTCPLSKTEKINSLLMPANIESSYDISILPGAIDNAALIVTAGYLDTNSSIDTNRDLIILAAGDINIDTLVTSSTPRITVISTKGSVAINSVKGMPQLKLISWLGSWINGKALKQENQLIPLIRELQVLGIY